MRKTFILITIAGIILLPNFVNAAQNKPASNCNKNLACLLKKAELCQPATGIVNSPTNTIPQVDPYFFTTQYLNFKIIGQKNKTCIFHYNLQEAIHFPPGVTKDKKTKLGRMFSKIKSNISRETQCTAETAKDLVAYIKGWRNGEVSKSSKTGCQDLNISATSDLIRCTYQGAVCQTKIKIK